MTRNALELERAGDDDSTSTPASSAAAKLLQRLLPEFSHGTLLIELPSGQTIERRGASHGPKAVLKFARWRALTRLGSRGDIGFAEGYMDGDWTTPNLVDVFEWAHANERALSPAWRGTVIERIVDRLRHAGRSNSRRGSRRNIAAHYDLGNDFYAAWLDASMSYSSALFRDGATTLEAAQFAKLDRAIALLDPPRGGRVLEIGCGWGALAERLIARRGCGVLGLTLSLEQLRTARARVLAADPSGASDVVLQDYRDVEGQFDGVVSIEMFEAAGEKYWPLYFERLRHFLKPGATAVLQVITIEEPRFEAYRRRPDFIQRYIFPGGMLPTARHMETLAAGAGLALQTVETFGSCYARTLVEWRERFLRAWPELEGRVGDRRFRNMWDYYLAYCEVGFRHGAIDVGLFTYKHAH